MWHSTKGVLGLEVVPWKPRHRLGTDPPTVVGLHETPLQYPRLILEGLRHRKMQEAESRLPTQRPSKRPKSPS